jgi:hypothetical protein
MLEEDAGAKALSTKLTSPALLLRARHPEPAAVQSLTLMTIEPSAVLWAEASAPQADSDTRTPAVNSAVVFFKAVMRHALVVRHSFEFI